MIRGVTFALAGAAPYRRERGVPIPAGGRWLAAGLAARTECGENSAAMQVITPQIRQQMQDASWIRRMFDAGLELKQRVGAENVFDFSLGNPDVPPPAAAGDALRALAERAVKPMGLGYCPNAGLPSVRATLARKISGEQQAPVEARHVILTCGAAGGLVTFFRAVLEPGDEVLCPAPYFVEYGAYAGHFGGVLRAVPSKAPEFALDVAALEAGPSGRAPASLIVNSPNNPAGCIYDAATLRALGEVLARRNAGRERPIFLVSDEPYRALAYDGATVPAGPPGLAVLGRGRLVLEEPVARRRAGRLRRREPRHAGRAGARWTP